MFWNARHSVNVYSKQTLFMQTRAKRTWRKETNHRIWLISGCKRLWKSWQLYLKSAKQRKYFFFGAGHFLLVSTWGLIKENIVVFLNLGFRVPVFQILIHFLWEIFRGVWLNMPDRNWRKNLLGKFILYTPVLMPPFPKALMKKNMSLRQMIQWVL